MNSTNRISLILVLSFVLLIIVIFALNIWALAVFSSVRQSGCCMPIFCSPATSGSSSNSHKAALSVISAESLAVESSEICQFNSVTASRLGCRTFYFSFGNSETKTTTAAAAESSNTSAGGNSSVCTTTDASACKSPATANGLRLAVASSVLALVGALLLMVGVSIRLSGNNDKNSSSSSSSRSRSEEQASTPILKKVPFLGIGGGLLFVVAALGIAALNEMTTDQVVIRTLTVEETAFNRDCGVSLSGTAPLQVSAHTPSTTGPIALGCITLPGVLFCAMFISAFCCGDGSGPLLLVALLLEAGFDESKQMVAVQEKEKERAKERKESMIKSEIAASENAASRGRASQGLLPLADDDPYDPYLGRSRNSATRSRYHRDYEDSLQDASSHANTPNRCGGNHNGNNPLAASTQRPSAAAAAASGYHSSSFEETDFSGAEEGKVLLPSARDPRQMVAVRPSIPLEKKLDPGLLRPSSPALHLFTDGSCSEGESRMNSRQVSDVLYAQQIPGQQQQQRADEEAQHSASETEGANRVFIHSVTLKSPKTRTQPPSPIAAPGLELPPTQSPNEEDFL